MDPAGIPLDTPYAPIKLASPEATEASTGELIRALEEAMEEEETRTRTKGTQTPTKNPPSRTWGDELDRCPLPLRLPNPALLCWRCGAPGHTRGTCKGPRVLFCSKCGKLGILSRRCPCQIRTPPRPSGPSIIQCSHCHRYTHVKF